MGCQPLDDFLSHVPDVEARRIVRTAPANRKGLGPIEKRPRAVVGRERYLIVLG
jgi:hypothetical protein